MHNIAGYTEGMQQRSHSTLSHFADRLCNAQGSGKQQAQAHWLQSSQAGQESNDTSKQASPCAASLQLQLPIAVLS